jgi:3-hydroxyisobutyrate dehydrogenase-like beta-hydroxyacid dehydrogenase
MAGQLVGFGGLGAMGRPMARNLINSSLVLLMQELAAEGR